MKTVSPALLAHFGEDCTTLAVLWKLTRTDTTVMGFTTHDQDIVYDGVTYAAGTGMTNTAKTSKSDLSVDNVEVTAFLDSSSITEVNIRAGMYDYATIEIRIVNWADLTMGDMKVITGTVGEIKMINGVFTAEIRGLTQQLTTVIGALYGPLCRAELGSGPQISGSGGGRDALDANNHYLCNINLALYRQSGSVDSSVDAVTIVPTAGLVMTGSATPSDDAPAGWFNDGVLTFTSGVMSGFTIDIKSWDGTTLKTFLPMPFQPAPGDSFTIEPGCDKFSSTCFAKFNNIVNHRGEPFIPGNDLILLYPNAKT